MATLQSYLTNVGDNIGLGDDTRIAQSFRFIEVATIESVKFVFRRAGTPTGNLYAQIYAHTGTFGSGLPTGAALAQSSPVDVSTLSTSYAEVEFTFSTPYQCGGYTPYFIACYFDRISGGGSDFCPIGISTETPTPSGNKAYSSNLATWSIPSGSHYLNHALYGSLADAIRTIQGIQSMTGVQSIQF